MIHLDCYCDSSVDCDREIVCSAFVVVQNKQTIHESFITYKGRCNNNGELVAILKAIEWVETLPPLDLPNHSIYIKTDSEEAAHSILYARQSVSLIIRNKQLSLKSQLADFKIIRAQRHQVQKAHCLAREGLKREIERLFGVSAIDKQRQMDKQIERQWILSKWLETCK